MKSVLAGIAVLALAGSAAFAQQAMMSGVISKVDEAAGKITIHQSTSGTVGSGTAQTEDFKVADGLLFNAVKPGDKVQFSVEDKNGAKTITKLEKQP